jgi:Zn-dependent protease with chaperone function
MTSTPSVRVRAAAAATAVTLALAVPAGAKPTTYSSGFNLFTPQQDVEIGRQSSAEAERQLPLLRDRTVDGYLESIVRRMAPNAPGPKFPYQVEAVNSADVNAFALPGGYVYVNRGTVEAADNEAELAGVIAHEMAHVALRHGTHQASRAYLAQAGLSVLGGIVGGRRGRGTAEILSAVGGLGLNALFLRYSRDAETQADVVGAQIMAASGYEPEQMARMFDKLQQMQKSQPGRLAQFFSDHPASADRAARIRQEAREIGPVREAAAVGGFDQVRAELRGRAPAPGRNVPVRSAAGGRGGPAGSVGSVRLEPPSTRFRTFDQGGGFFTLEYPDNWQAGSSDNGYGATLAPQGGVVDVGNGQQAIVCGVIVNHYDPFADRSSDTTSLAQATEDIVAQVQQSNPYLRAQGSPQRASLDEQRALRVTLSGRSPVTGQDEDVTIYTRALDDGHVIYAVFVVPRDAERTFQPAFSRIVDTLRVDDRAAHR